MNSLVVNQRRQTQITDPLKWLREFLESRLLSRLSNTLRQLLIMCYSYSYVRVLITRSYIAIGGKFNLYLGILYFT